MSGFTVGNRVETTTFGPNGEVISATIVFQPTRCNVCNRVLETSQDWSRCRSDHAIQKLQQTPEGRRTLQMCIAQIELNKLATKQHATNSPSVPPTRPVVPPAGKANP